jgi:hypothetical protein
MTEQDRFLVEEPVAATMAMTHTLVNSDPSRMSGPRFIGDRHE